MNSTATIFVETVITEVTISSTRGYWDKSHYVSRGPTGHWTKWGGARMDLIQEDIGDTWTCQSCGDNQPNALSPYKYEWPEGEYIRCCARCIADNCQALRDRIGL